MNTILRYFQSGELETQATILAVYPVGEFEDDDRPSIVLSETVMQHEAPDRIADQGWIDDEPVVLVTRSRLGRVLHHIAGAGNGFAVGQQVRVKVEPACRQLQSGLLCAGRLIELVGPIVFADLAPVAADFRPNRSKVEFGAGEFLPSPESVRPDFCREVERYINRDLPIRFSHIDGDTFRRVQIGDFRPFPCSGVYPVSLKAIAHMLITNVVAVGGRLQVRYRLQ
jgi:Ser-tRNA(Ala) deacylase AlaX